MSGLQNLTNPRQSSGAKDAGGKPLITPQQNEWISFCATGGLITYADGELKTMTVRAFADLLGVSHVTLYNWRESIPDFWKRVEARRNEIFSADRVAKVWNGVFLRAAKGDAKQAEMVLSQYGGYVPPAQRHEVKVDGFGDLVNIARQRANKAAQGAIEGEVVQPAQIGATTPQAPSADEFE